MFCHTIVLHKEIDKFQITSNTTIYSVMYYREEGLSNNIYIYMYLGFKACEKEDWRFNSLTDRYMEHAFEGPNLDSYLLPSLTMNCGNKKSFCNSKF